MNQKIPEDIQERFVKAAAKFQIKTGVPTTDIQEFIMDIITIYHDYMFDEEEEE